jgi:hypothetical protein
MPSVDVLKDAVVIADAPKVLFSSSSGRADAPCHAADSQVCHDQAVAQLLLLLLAAAVASFGSARHASIGRGVLSEDGLLVMSKLVQIVAFVPVLRYDNAPSRDLLQGPSPECQGNIASLRC